MENLSDLFVPYKIALRLKKKGFNEPCLASFKNKKLQLVLIDGTTQAPTYQQVVDWLAKKFNIDILLDITYDNKNGNWYYYKIFLNGKSKSYTEGAFSKIFASNTAIEEALKII